jgi:hypothetical protein
MQDRLHGTGKIVLQGHLFGPGYVMESDLKIGKSLNDHVQDICLPKCRDDPKCTGMQFRINARYDGRTNGNCWFMTGEIKYVDAAFTNNAGGGVYVKSSVGGYCEPDGSPALLGEGCLDRLICDAASSTCKFE